MPRGFKTDAERVAATTERNASVNESFRDRQAERRDKLRTWMQLGTLVVTTVVAVAAIMGIQTLEARKERDDATKEAQAARLETAEAGKVVELLRNDITTLDARRARAEAELGQTRLRVLQAEAREKEMGAKLQTATADSQRYRIFGKFYGRVLEECLKATSARYTGNSRGFQLCMADVLGADPEFQQLSRADSTAMVARATPAAPTVLLSASPTSIGVNGYSTLSWSSTNASSCTASGAWSGTKAQAGSEPTALLSNTATYSMQCTGQGGSAGDSRTITVTAGLGGSSGDASGGGRLSLILLATLVALVSYKERRKAGMSEMRHVQEAALC